MLLRAGAAVPVTVDRTLTLNRSDKDAEKTQALLVTPADRKRTSVYHADADSTTVYTSEPTDPSTFRVSYDQGNQAKDLLAYGVAAYSVTVDGKALSRLTALPADGTTVGYYVESGNVTKIYLGTADWKNVDITLGDYRTIDQLDHFTDAAADVLLNRDTTAFYNVDGSLTAVLKETALVSSVTLKWGTSYSSGYTVAVSEDGQTWTDVKTVEGATGGVETVSFSPVRARYVRLTVHTAVGGAQATLYQMQVNKSLTGVDSKPDDTYKPVTDPDNNTSYVDSDTDTDGDSTVEPDEDDEIQVIKKRRLVKQGENRILGMRPVVFFLVLGAVVVLLAAGIVVLLLWLRRKKKANSAEA